MNKSLQTFLAMLICSTLSFAQDFWQHAPAPTGGTIRSMVEADNGNILVGTWEGTFLSADNGSSWALSQDGMSNHYNTDLFKHTNGDIYACGFDRLSGSNLFRSVDNGQNWTQIPNLPLVPATDPTQLVVVNSSGDIFVGGTTVGNFIVSRSTDDGANWTTVLTNGLLNIITDLDVTATDDILVGVSTGSEGGLHRSTDNGDTWEHIYSDEDVLQIFVDPSGDIYLACESTVQHSTDNGGTWSEVYNSDSLPEFWDAPGAVTVNGAGDIFVGAGNFGVGGEGIGLSTDGGTTWSFVNNGLPEFVGFGGSYPRVYRILSHSGGTLFSALDASFARLTSSSGLGGVYTSDDNGGTWAEAGSGIQSINIASIQSQGNGTVFAAPLLGLLYSDDDGATWSDKSPESFGSPFPVTAIGYGITSGNVYAGGGFTGGFQSTDMGLTWSDMGLGTVSPVGIGENSSGDIFVASNGGVHRSLDGGANWTQVYSGGSTAGLWISQNDDVFMTGFVPGGLRRSTDNGDTWEELNNGISGGVTNFTFGLGATLYASDVWGIHRSDDNGDSWTQMDDGIPTGASGNSPPVVKALNANSIGHVFASVEYFDDFDNHHYDMFRTTDGGNNWAVLSSGIVGNYSIINDISIHDDGVAYLGGTNGVYRSMESTTEVRQVDSGIPAAFGLDQNYPNPFNPTTTIGFQVPENGFVSLKVYDILGREVADLVDERLDAGNYTASFNAENLSSGVYITTMTSGSFQQVRKMILMK